MRRLLPCVLSAALAVSCVDERENLITRSKEMLRGDSSRYIEVRIAPYPLFRTRFTSPIVQQVTRFYDTAGDNTVDQYVILYARENSGEDILGVETDLLRPGARPVFYNPNLSTRREMTPDETEEIDRQYQELVTQYLK